jgi:DNA-binding transcriptional LysR family regulator
LGYVQAGVTLGKSIFSILSIDPSDDVSALNLASTDLNLLVAFDALMAERSVTRAGQRIGVGQPGMSAILARLRDTFRDELFVRVPGKPMKPTRRAIALHAPVAEILARVSRVLSAETTFDPATARANILIATGDPAGTLVAPHLLRLLSTKAPGIDIRLVSLDKRDAFDQLDRGDIDLVFASFAKVPKRIRRERLFTDTYVCVVRREHVRGGRRRAMDLETYVTTPHILMTLAGDERGIVDEALAKLGRRRRVAVTVPSTYLIPRLVEETGMISHLPRRIAAEVLRGSDLVMLSPPVALPEWHIDMYWGAASALEPTASWIRSRLSEIGQQIRMADKPGSHQSSRSQNETRVIR